MTRRRSRVFLSYPRGDRAVAGQLYEALQGESLDVWFDEANLVPGAAWETEIKRAVDRADVILVLIGKGSLSPRSQREYETAVRRLKHSPSVEIVPILTPGSSQEDVPFVLRQFPVIDLSNEALRDKNAMRVAAR